MSVPPVSVPIEIVVTGKIFPCPTGASSREVVDAIRDDSLLMGGHLERNGVAVIGGSITDEGIYRFVGGEVRSISKGTGKIIACDFCTNLVDCSCLSLSLFFSLSFSQGSFNLQLVSNC